MQGHIYHGPNCQCGKINEEAQLAAAVEASLKDEA